MPVLHDGLWRCGSLAFASAPAVPHSMALLLTISWRGCSVVRLDGVCVLDVMCRTCSTPQLWTVAYMPGS